MNPIEPADVITLKDGEPSLTGTPTAKGEEALNAIKTGIGIIFEKYFTEGVECQIFDVSSPSGWQIGRLKIALVFQPSAPVPPTTSASVKV